MMNAVTIGALNERLAAHKAALLEATVKLVQAEEALAVQHTTATNNCWSALLAEVKAIHDEAKATPESTKAAIAASEIRAVLNAYKAEAATQGNPAIGKRAVQYASNLARVAKALEAGEKIPASLWKASRTEYLEAPFWRERGILSASGRKGKGTGRQQPNAGAGEGQQGPETDSEPSQAVAAARAILEDDAAREVLDRLSRLSGPFRAEAYSRIREVLDSVERKQAKATGTGQQ